MHLCSNSNQWQKLPILSSQSPYLPGCLFYFLWTLNLKSYTWNELDLLNKQKIPLVTFSVINIPVAKFLWSFQQVAKNVSHTTTMCPPFCHQLGVNDCWDQSLLFCFVECPYFNFQIYWRGCFMNVQTIVNNFITIILNQT